MEQLLDTNVEVYGIPAALSEPVRDVHYDETPGVVFEDYDDDGEVEKETDDDGGDTGEDDDDDDEEEEEEEEEEEDDVDGLNGKLGFG
ncbi:hypothetical protein SprV_0301360700 [Sparganum proliferum]